MSVVIKELIIKTTIEDRMHKRPDNIEYDLKRVKKEILNECMQVIKKTQKLNRER